MAKRPTPLPTPAMLETYEATLREYRTLVEGYRQLCDRYAAVIEERDREDRVGDHNRYAWSADEHTMGLTEALEQILGLFTDLIHVEDLVTLREVDRRHILLVLAQARQAIDDYDLDVQLRDEVDAVPDAQD